MTLASKLAIAIGGIATMVGFLKLAEAGVSGLWLFVAYSASCFAVLAGIYVIRRGTRARMARAAGLGPIGSTLGDEAAERGVEAVLEALID